MKRILVFLMVALISFSAFASGAAESASSSVAADEITEDDLRAANITLELWHAQTNENGIALDMVVDLFNETNGRLLRLPQQDRQRPCRRHGSEHRTGL